MAVRRAGDITDSARVGRAVSGGGGKGGNVRPYEGAGRGAYNKQWMAFSLRKTMASPVTTNRRQWGVSDAVRPADFEFHGYAPLMSDPGLLMQALTHLLPY
jgi:hypothetical protein